ncbi:MAG: 4Fe-4S dicluster domain-containing protein, partial [Longimicrobiales bacterium]|nr:4Fe-4S dicluster domain-containing protein [Longimicrobiales bacterium]
MNRRELIQTMGAAAGATLLSSRPARAEAGAMASTTMGVLVDTTLCMGCRTCEWACAEAHAGSGVEYEEDVDPSVERTTSERQWTVVNEYETDVGPVSVKRQCMHCLQPACASACLTRAMHKTPEGPVAWTEDRCMGCRFCMVSCPFDVPKFEYDSAVPRIQKCTMCWEDRVSEGAQPACVENCPVGALTFGPRAELLEEARRRIYTEPDRYVSEIYGEHEAGGTGYLYLAGVPFDQLGFRTDIARTSYPALTREFLYAVPVVLTLVPPFLVGLSRASRSEPESVE